MDMGYLNGEKNVVEHEIVIVINTVNILNEQYALNINCNLN